MKYGNQLERESVPEWSYHNLDYNSLKHEIKVHTTRDQATAIAIPGHHDVALRKFEDALYKELCSQHDRVDLFVTSKADEVLRRLDHLSESLQRWAAKNSHEPETAGALLKRQSRFVKFERELLRCGEDIHSLSRFANAQVIAFHKILKKYRKWTGSTTLSSRFNEIVLSNPKSFTKRSFSHLQQRHDEIYERLQKLSPSFCEPSSPSSVETNPLPDPIRFPRSPQVTFDTLPPPAISSSVQIKYWNEYDDGSDAEGMDEGYTIYVDPDEELAIPGLKYIKYPFVKVRDWLRLGHLDDERERERERRQQQPLYSPEMRDTRRTRGGYGAISQGSTTTHTAYLGDSDEELGGYSSSDGALPTWGYASHFALPSLGDQRMRRYRERVLMWGTVACFAASFVFLGIAGILISTGRHKLHVEVDSGATVGAVVSLFCACSALGMTLYREDALPVLYRAIVWVTFVVTCVLNGMLFVVILGNTAP